MEFPTLLSGISVPVLCGIIFLIFRNKKKKPGKRA